MSKIEIGQAYLNNNTVYIVAAKRENDFMLENTLTRELVAFSEDEINRLKSINILVMLKTMMLLEKAVENGGK